MALPPDSIDALMVALKRREGSSGLDGMGGAPGSASPSSPIADPGADDDMPDPSDPDIDHDTDANTAKTNATIVGILQSDYPKIFAKISLQVEDDPDAQQGPPNGDDMPPPGMTDMQP